MHSIFPYHTIRVCSCVVCEVVVCASVCERVCACVWFCSWVCVNLQVRDVAVDTDLWVCVHKIMYTFS